MTMELDDNIGVYVIINTRNGKMYVGSSEDLYHRYHYHRSRLKHGRNKNKPLQKDYDKYPAGTFEFETIILCSKEDLVTNEQYLMDELGFENTYNEHPNSKSSTGFKHSDESRANMSESKKGIKRKPFTDEHKRNMSEAKKGFKHSAKSRANMSKAKKGKTFTKEHKANMCISQQRRQKRNRRLAEAVA